MRTQPSASGHGDMIADDDQVLLHGSRGYGSTGMMELGSEARASELKLDRVAAAGRNVSKASKQLVEVDPSVRHLEPLCTHLGRRALKEAYTSAANVRDPARPMCQS